jgi:hypothetical protein
MGGKNLILWYSAGILQYELTSGNLYNIRIIYYTLYYYEKEETQ